MLSADVVQVATPVLGVNVEDAAEAVQSTVLVVVSVKVTVPVAANGTVWVPGVVNCALKAIEEPKVVGLLALVEMVTLVDA